MKLFVSFALLIFATTFTYSKTPVTVLDFYEEYSKSQNYYKIFNYNSYYYITLSDDEDDRLPVLVDIKNGYLSFSDEGTGGSSYDFEMALFKRKDNNYYIAVNKISFDAFYYNISRTIVYSYDDGKWTDHTANVVPQINASNFLKSDYFKAMGKEILEFFSSKVEYNNYLKYKLPRYGTEITITSVMSEYLDIALERNESGSNSTQVKKLLSDIKNNIIVNMITLKWDKNSNKFIYK